MALPQEKSAKDWFNRIIANPIRISVWVLILSVFVVVGLTLAHLENQARGRKTGSSFWKEKQIKNINANKNEK